MMAKLAARVQRGERPALSVIPAVAKRKAGTH